MLIRATWHRFARVLRRVYRDYSETNVWLLSAAIGYYTFLSIFPLLLVAVSILGFTIGSAGAQHVVARGLERLLPGAATGIEVALERIVSHRGVAFGLGLAGLLYGASGVYNALLFSLRTVWRMRPARRGWLVYVRAISGVLLSIMLLVVSIGITSLLQALIHYSLFGISLDRFPVLSGWLGIAAPIFTDFLVFMVLYLSVPHPRLGWGSLALGAGFAAVTWELAKVGFTWYITHVAAVDKVYGSLGGVVILLLWIYYSAVIALVGAILARAHEQVSPASPRGQDNSRQAAGGVRRVPNQ